MAVVICDGVHSSPDRLSAVTEWDGDGGDATRTERREVSAVNDSALTKREPSHSKCVCGKVILTHFRISN